MRSPQRNRNPVPWHRPADDLRIRFNAISPKSGSLNLGSVPFRMFGKFDLTGLGRARDGEFQPTRVGEIPVGHRANRVHLLHGASYDSPDGTPVACLLLRYKDDSVRRFFISYGVHVRNWYVERNETVHDLSDPRS